jgi:hypothetical protein
MAAPQKKLSKPVLLRLAYGSPIIAVVVAALLFIALPTKAESLRWTLNLLVGASAVGVCAGIAGLVGVAIYEWENKVGAALIAVLGIALNLAIGWLTSFASAMASINC